MFNGPFNPNEQSTYLIGNAAAVQVPNSPNTPSGPSSYRIRALLSTTQYITWAAPTASGSAPSITATAPAAGTPSRNTLGMIGPSVEVFNLPPNAWFIANAVGAFEVTPGEGM